MDPTSLANHYSPLCATSTTPHSIASQLGPQQCLDLYSKGLTEAASLQQKSVKESTRKARTTAVRELADWLQANATCKRSLLTATPEDLLVYFTQHWLPNHAGSSTAAGVLIAAPSSLSCDKSHLATEFEVLGRTGDWDTATQQGNPMHSMQVRSMLKGYANHAAELGYQNRGPVPLTQAEMQALLNSMYQMLSSTGDTAQQLLLVPDGLLFTILWQTCYRGFNVGGVRLANIVLPTGGNAVLYLVPNKLQPGAILHLLPDTTKNKKGGHSSVTLTCDLLCMSTWLQLAVAQYAAAGQPVTNYLTRPLQVGTKTYTETGMTCSNAWARLTKYLKELGMYTGQSVHSTRRGSMIHKQLQMHDTHKEIGEAAMCSEQNAKYYTDTGQPGTGPKAAFIQTII